MKNHRFTVAFLVLALILYAAGMAAGAMVLLLAGLAAEAVFWMSLVLNLKR